MTFFSSISGKILAGNMLFTACCIVYLIWWSVAFRPGYQAPIVLKLSLLAATAFLGVFALAMIIAGCQGHSPFRNIFIIAVAAVVYVVLLVVTNVCMGRQVTTELMLIVIWTCVEVCACGALCGDGVFSTKVMLILICIVVVAAAIGMLCYLKYYDLAPMPAFYDGMVPLILFAAVMIGISVVQLICMRGH